MSSQSQRVQEKETEDSGPDFLVVWRNVRKYWMTTLAVALIVASGVTFYTLGQKKIYRATATVMFDPNPPRPLGSSVEQVVELGSGSFWDAAEYYETQYQIIRSADVALATVDELGLHNDLGFIQNLAPGETPIGDKGVEREVASDILRGRLSVSPVKGSRLAEVEIEDADPERAARVLDELVEVYVERNVSNAGKQSKEVTEFLHNQLTTLKGDLESSELELHNYKETNRLLSVEYADKSNMLREEMGQLNTALTEVKTQQVEVAARRSQLLKVNPTDPINLPASEFVQNALLSTLKTEYTNARRERDALLGAGKGAKHPDVQAATAQVELAREALLAEVRNIQGAVDRDLAVVSAQAGGLNALLDSSKDEALKLNRLEIDYNRLNRERLNNEKLYGMVIERAKETDLAGLKVFNNISIVDHPRVPGGPIRPQVPLNIAAGIMAGLILGIGAAFGRGMLDRTIKNASDVEQRLNAYFLGLLPEIGDAASKVARVRPGRRKGVEAGLGPELSVHNQPTGGVAEAARAIRTNLMFMAPDNPYRTLLVASAGPADGKTTVACCIATAMAQAGKRVLLLDCDLRRPRVHRIFGMSLDVGLTSALLDQDEEVVFETPVPNLAVTVAGPIPPNPAEILQSEKFRKYLEQAKTEFDMIVIDSPPLVAVTDAVILSKMVDGTVLVVRANKTRIEVAQLGMRNLTDVGANVAGVVLNAVNVERDEYRYSYQYYRQDHTYSADRPSTSGRARKKRTAKEDPAAPPSLS